MKKITFGNNNAPVGKEPFWQPWGLGGWLWRLIVFLLLLFLLLLLLSLFKRPQQRRDRAEIDPYRTEELIPRDIREPGDPIAQVPVDTTSQVPRDIEDPGPYLPQPGDNHLNPIDEDDIIEDDQHRQIVSNRLNVILDSSADDSTFRRWSEEFKQLYPGDEYKVVYYDPLTKLIQIEVPADMREQLIVELPQKITDIRFKVFSEEMFSSTSHRPNDPAFQHRELSWYFDPIQCLDAWDITMGSPNVTVAIVDSYFDLNHDELSGDRIVKPYSVVRRTGNVAPDEGAASPCFEHGSMVASQAIGNIDNQRGSAGIAPKCKFMPVSMGQQFTTMTIMQGLLYAIYQGASVVNISAGMSLGDALHQLSPEEQIALSQQFGQQEQDVWDFISNLANERNVTIVWAAGNDDLFSGLDISKRGNATIKVSALDTNLKKASFSNFGNFAELGVEESTVSAPGVDIMGAKPFNTYDIGPGTSFAAPIVTGAVALMKSIDPTLSTREIIAILKETGKPVAGCPTIGPMIQIKDALLQVKENFANFDAIMRDHSKFIGLWRTTTLLHRVDGDGVDHPEDELRLYFDIKTDEDGQFICCEVRPRDDYAAPIKVQWGNNKIVMHMTSKATCNGRERNYDQKDYTCIADPNSDDLLCTHQVGNSEARYYLRKVLQREDE